MTEAKTPFASLGYEPVGPIINRLLARYLRTQRKNMRRFFQERGLYALADRMNQIRNSRQGMMAKNKMFQEVLNSYASQNVQAPTQAPKHVGAVHGMRSESFQVVAEGEPGEGSIKVDGVAESQPRTAASDPEQALRIPDTDPPTVEDL